MESSDSNETTMSFPWISGPELGRRLRTEIGRSGLLGRKMVALSSWITACGCMTLSREGSSVFPRETREIVKPDFSCKECRFESSQEFDGLKSSPKATCRNNRAARYPTYFEAGSKLYARRNVSWSKAEILELFSDAQGAA